MSKRTTKFDAMVILAILVLIAGILWLLAAYDIKNPTLFAAMATGVVGPVLLIWANFRWGSSQGSDNKDAQISQLTQHIAEIAKRNATQAQAMVQAPEVTKPDDAA